MILRVRLRIRKRRLACFVHPAGPVSRTAILALDFQETNLVRVFPRGWDRRVERFRPASIAAPLDQLRQLAEVGIALDHSLVAFTRQGEPGLSAEDRELFWDAFGVPVYEQLLGSDNRLLASECDAHCGLHVASGYGGERLETEPCGCGNPAPRIVRTSRIHDLAEMLA